MFFYFCLNFKLVIHVTSLAYGYKHFYCFLLQVEKKEVFKFLMVSKVVHSGFACSNDKLECYLQLHQFTLYKKNNYQDGK